MKAFLASLAVFALLAVGTAWVFENWIGVTATQAYSRDSARPEVDNTVAARPGFAPNVAETEADPAE